MELIRRRKDLHCTLTSLGRTLRIEEIYSRFTIANITKTMYWVEKNTTSENCHMPV